MTEPHNHVSAEAELLKSIDAKLNAQSFREDMRRRAHAWDAQHPWARLLARNPWEQYK